MGSLKHSESKRIAQLMGHCIVGRGPASDIVLQSATASMEHAALSWSSRGWKLRDLGSRNGTRVNGMSLAFGERRALFEGDHIEFGDADETWILVEAHAPPAAARNDQGAVVQEERGLLVIPGETQPEVCVYREGEDWMLDGEFGVRPVRHGDVLEVQGQRWTLELPEADDNLTPTRSLESSVRLEQLTLSFTVSRDEETVRVVAAWPGGGIELPTRAHNYTLLVLARARLEDTAAGVVDDEAGWLPSISLSEMLKVSAEKLNLDIHRARRSLAEQGVAGAVHIIERRPSARAVRLGVASIAIHQLGAR